MTAEQFCRIHPSLYHVTAPDALPQIQRHGLQSTLSLLRLVEASPEMTAKLSTTKRKKLTPLAHPVHGNFVLRDQTPLSDSALEKCLVGMTVKEWYLCLNARVFLFAQWERIERLLNAYRKIDQLILTLDSKRFLEAHYDSVYVAKINTGATIRRPLARGVGTFIPLRDLPATRSARLIAEVTVPDGIADVANFISATEIRKQNSLSTKSQSLLSTKS